MIDNLYKDFHAVPREYTVRPFWFWNGPLTPAEVQRQIEALVSQGVYGAYVHNRSGLRPRYLSEEWWGLVRAGLEKARESGFEFDVVDEYNWPSGEARDYTQPGYPSRVLAANENFRMRSLDPGTRTVSGGQAIKLEPLAEHDYVVVGRRTPSGELDAESLQDITPVLRASNGDWQAPDGQWAVFEFRLKNTVGVDGGQVDLMNPEAVQTFIKVVYEEYRRHAGSEFGKAFRSFFVDHEGDYGWRLAWTPRLFETFKALKGYDLVPMLPLLLEEGGKRTPTVRCDYFDVIGTLYTNSFFKQLSDWGAANGLHVTGHVWEESLQAQTAFQGDHFRIQRAFNTPGVDSLFEWGRYPRHLKEAASVAHFRKKPLVVENQGVQGLDNFLSLERIKRTTNMLGMWGTTVFVPHAIVGNPNRIEFPESWFENQPWWRFFHHYADYAARICTMNSGGRHVCDVLLYYPIETAWAHGDVCFSPEKWSMGFDGIDTERGQILHWHNVVDELNATYGEIIDTLPAHLWDLDIADEHYLTEATIADTRLHLADEAFKVLILPPMTTIRLSAARRARQFSEAGGIVIAVGRLPFDSMEGGRDDPALRREWEALFGTAVVERARSGSLPADPIQQTTGSGGKGVWVADVPGLLAFLEQNVERDVRVVQGDVDHLFALHRVKDNCPVYWFVNDRDAARQVIVDVAASGYPQIWDPDGGSRQPVTFMNRGLRTELQLSFEPWQGYYVVFDPQGTAQSATVTRTNLPDYQLNVGPGGEITVSGTLPASGGEAEAQIKREGQRLSGTAKVARRDPILLGGTWTCKPLSPSVPVCYARMQTAPDGQGVAQGWHLPGYNDAFWKHEWLSAERFAVTDWWVLGMFDYHYALGFNEVMPPEREINLEAEYAGRNDQPIRWQRYTSPDRIVDLDRAFGTEAERNYAVRWVTAFAFTNVYSPDERTVEVRCVADCNAKVWVNGELVIAERDDHHGYLEMRDAFGIKAAVHLREGWNAVLLKVSQGIRFAGIFGFVLRFCDASGQHLPDLRFAASPRQEADEKATVEHWYRINVPPGATAVHIPDLPVQLYADGAPLDVQPGRIALPADARLLALCLRDGAELPDFVTFDTGSIEGPLQSWTHTGLSFYKGEFAYSRQFELTQNDLAYRLMLDLGAVGTTAEVWLNGVRIGERVWRPFTFDISAAARQGTNELRILVANTSANERAGGHTEKQMWGVAVRGPGLLDALEENGLLGPVRVIPWAHVNISCS
jgi:hypothetical protein